jgi:hypothetical protein
MCPLESQRLIVKDSCSLAGSDIKLHWPFERPARNANASPKVPIAHALSRVIFLAACREKTRLSAVCLLCRWLACWAENLPRCPASPSHQMTLYLATADGIPCLSSTHSAHGSNPCVVHWSYNSSIRRIAHERRLLGVLPDHLLHTLALYYHHPGDRLVAVARHVCARWLYCSRLSDRMTGTSTTMHPLV